MYKTPEKSTEYTNQRLEKVESNNPNINGKELPLVTNLYDYIEEKRESFIYFFIEIVAEYYEPIRNELTVLEQEKSYLDAAINEADINNKNELTAKMNELTGKLLHLSFIEKTVKHILLRKHESISSDDIFISLFSIFNSISYYHLSNVTATVLKTPINLQNQSLLLNTGRDELLKQDIRTLNELIESIFNLSFNLLALDKDNQSLFNKLAQLQEAHTHKIPSVELNALGISIDNIHDSVWESLTPNEQVILDKSILPLKILNGENVVYEERASLFSYDLNGYSIPEKDIVANQSIMFELIKELHRIIWLKRTFAEHIKEFDDELAKSDLEVHKKKQLRKKFNANKPQLLQQLQRQWEQEENPWTKQHTIQPTSLPINYLEELQTLTGEAILPKEPDEQQKQKYTPEYVLSLIEPYLEQRSQRYLIAIRNNKMISDSWLVSIGKILEKIPTLSKEKITNEIFALFAEKKEFSSKKIEIVATRTINNRVYENFVKISLNNGHRMLIYYKNERVIITLLSSHDSH